MSSSAVPIEARGAPSGALQPHETDAPTLRCRWAALFALALFAYLTLLPFDFDLSRGSWAQGRTWPHLAWSQPSADDVVANVAVGIALGVVIGLSLRRRVAHPPLRIATTTLIVLAASLAVEVVQTLIRSRVAAVSDVALNALAGLAGALLAATLAGRFARAASQSAKLLRTRPATLGFAAAAVLITLNSWMPFDFRRPADGLRQVDLSLTGPALTINSAGPDAWRSLIDRAGDCSYLLVLGLFALLSRRETGEQPTRAAMESLARVVLLVLLWEVGQIALASHVFSLSTIATRLLAAGAGMWFALAMIDAPGGTWRREPRMMLSHSVLVACLFVQIAYLLTRAAVPLTGGVNGFQVQALPFYGEFRRPFLPAVASVWQQAVPYAVLALTAAACSSLRGVVRTLPRVLLLVMSVSVVTELLAAMGPSGLFDVTDVLLPLAGAAAGVWVHAWIARRAAVDRLPEPEPAAMVQPTVEGDLVTVATMIPPHLAHRWRAARPIDPQAN